jgi:pimeloyl-[acyl-carrier protein] synthase
MSPSPSSIPTFGSPAYYQNPYPAYRAWLDSGQRAIRISPHLVAVTHYRDCLDLLRDPRLSAKRYIGKLAHFTEEEKLEFSAWQQACEKQMLFIDPPHHGRVRKPLMRAFSPEAIAARQPRIVALFHEILERVPSGVEIDFMQTIAHPFPALVIGEILGIPPGRWERLMEWSDSFAEFIGAFQAPVELGRRATRATVEMLDYLGELIDRKRSQPGDDVLSMMIHSVDDGEPLSRDELLAQGVLLLVAGHETTRNLIGNGILTLLRHPAQMNQLRHDRTLLRGAVEEILRFEGPLQGTSRLALEDMEFHGEKIQTGQSLLAIMGCANRDQRQFPDPDRFDLARKNNPHLDFGAGAHACLGLHMARLETQIALSALLDRYRNIELREEDPQWNPAFTLRGLKRLNVVLN